MKKIVALTLSTLAFSVAGMAPVFADDSNPFVKAFMLPVKVVAFGATAVVGTPIAIVRTSAKNTVKSTKTIGGDNGNAVTTGFAAIVGLPLGVFTGTLEGTYHGIANAAIHTDKPFSKEEFSLGEIEEK